MEETRTPGQIAHSLVYGDRNVDYGHPYDDYMKNAALWSPIIGTKITAKQCAMCMICVKLARLEHALKPDSVVDTFGYALVMKRIDEREQELGTGYHARGCKLGKKKWNKDAMAFVGLILSLSDVPLNEIGPRLQKLSKQLLVTGQSLTDPGVEI
jgi:Domain of unknown function (DUF6378)